MRIAKPEIINNKNLINIVDINEIPKACRHVNLITDKDKIKFIKRVENVVRGSMEYKDYIAYLKEFMDLTACHFYKKVDTAAGRKVRLEIHHEPFTLFDITRIVLNKWIEEGKSISEFLIAEEVMELHYKNRVGLIPLSITVHELVHDGKIIIPLQNVYGRGFTKFVVEYEDYIDNETREILNRKIKTSRDIMMEQNLDILERRYTYLSVDGFELPNIQQIENS